ncbi:MAG TPA: efflux RND transporter permease subunit, partial [Candidatus Moranbacteria bacterium]|nr:efflux RND transporter permease subunit [Candidatus Moranbacteria bacterium]
MKKTSIKKEAKSPGGFLREYLGTPVFATVALLVLLAAGVYSFVSLPRTVNPEINLTLVNLSAVLPGASPEEVEKLLAVPLEKELSGLGGLKNITSLAGEGHLLATLEFEDEIDRQTAVAEARAAVSRVDLPSLARRVTVKAVNFEDEPILRAAVYDSAGPVALQKNVRAIKEEMEKSSLIDRVYADGVGKKKIYISAPAEEFFLRGVTPPLLRELIWQKMLSQPAGEVRQGESALPLTVSGSVSTLDDLRALPLKTAQGSYRLGDFARVIEMEDPSTLGAFITDRDGHIRPAAVLTVYRSLNAPIAAATAEAEKILRTAEEKSPTLQTVKIWSVNDDMNEQFADLGRNLVLTVILVFALLWFFVGFAQAAAAALSIPMVYLGAFAVMYFFDLSINFITLFSLLLGLGLLVDVTIVIISALAVRLRRAEEALSAAMAVWREFAGALAITTLTTVWAFLPLFLSSGVIGEYIKPIPIVVTAILTFSFLVGFGIILPLSVAWARRLTAGGKVAGKFSLGGRPSGFAASVGFLEKTYRKVLRKIIFRPRFRRSVWAVLTVFFLVSFALPVLGLVRNEFFPSTDFSYLYVSAELPAAA